jgi:hypothetical protein
MDRGVQEVMIPLAFAIALCIHVDAPWWLWLLALLWATG